MMISTTRFQRGFIIVVLSRCPVMSGEGQRRDVRITSTGGSYHNHATDDALILF
jgi:hypothetical protein